MSEIEIPDFIDNAEHLYRGVIPDQWKDDEGCPSTSVFKSRVGASADRDALIRTEEECVSALVTKKTNLKAVCSLTAETVRKIGAYPIYKPSRVDVYHSEIHDSDKKVIITAKTKLYQLTIQSKVIMVEPSPKSEFVQLAQSNTERSGEILIQDESK